MTILVFSPGNSNVAAPGILMLSFDNTRSRNFDADEKQPGKLRNGIPLGKIFENGFAFVVAYQGDLVGHNEVKFDNTIHHLFFREGQSFPNANEWGVLSACGWGAMQVMDYLKTESNIDHTKIALMGHSKLGKAALWSAAQDTRFAMAISAQSGCAKAALWRRRFGETLAKMVTRFPYWLCRNAWKFINLEDDLPVDQHMLLALMAPRPVYVASAVDDLWADPRGEYLSAYQAGKSL